MYGSRLNRRKDAKEERIKMKKKKKKKSTLTAIKISYRLQR